MENSPIEIVDFDAFITNTITYFAMSGIHLEVGTDFSEYERILSQDTRPHYIRPTFSKENKELNEGNSFWIVGRNDADDIIHIQAVHSFDLKDGTLADHFTKHVKDYSSFREDHHKLRFNPGPNSTAITGTVCYHGEFWLNIGPSSCGTASLGTLLSKLAMAMSMQRWNVDCFFAFVMALKACRGLAARGGYLHAEPNSVVWEVPEKAGLQESWLVWSNKKDIEYLIEIIPALLVKGLSRNTDQKKKVAVAA